MARDDNRAGNTGARRNRGRLAKILMIVGGAVVGVGAVLVVLAPTIAGSIAPGLIESAASKQIKGSVKVSGLSVGWFSAISAGPIEVRDTSGRLAATLNVATGATMWTIVSQHWWSAKRLDIGTVELSGKLDLVRDASGKTNLQEAVETQKPAPKAAEKKSGGGIESLRAALRINSLDISVRDKFADGTMGPEQGVKNLKGDVSVDYGGASVKLATDLTGTAIMPAGGSGIGAGGDMRVKLDAQASSAGATIDAKNIEKFNAKGEITGLPVAVVDALSNMGGALVEGMGPRVDVYIDSGGSLKSADVKAKMTSEGVQGEFDMTVRDGVLAISPGAASGANTISVKSTAFLAKVPQLREAMERAGERMTLTSAAPAMTIAIEKLRLPVSGEGDAIDARGMGALASVRVGAMDGRLTADSSATGSGAKGLVRGVAHSFHTEPMSIELKADDLARPITIQGGTAATIDGRAGGTISIFASAGGLLDERGGIKALGKSGRVAGAVNAEVRVQGLSSALVQPLLAGAGLGLDAESDLGPTLDAHISARADLSETTTKQIENGQYPSADASISVQSAAVRAGGDVRIAQNVLTGGERGLTLEVDSLTPIARRLINTGGAPEAGSLVLGGRGRLRATVRDLTIGLDKLKGEDAMSAIRASVNASIDDVQVSAGVDGSGAGGAARQPLNVQNSTFVIDVTPGAPPRVVHQGQLSFGGQGFTSSASVALEGLQRGRLPSGGGLDALFRFGARGEVALTNVPREVIAMFSTPELSDSGGPNPVFALVRGAIGRTATVTTKFEPLGEGGSGGTSVALNLTTEAGGLGGAASGKVTAQSATLSGAEFVLRGDPNALNPVLAQSAAAGSQAMRIVQAFNVTAKVTEPIVIPLVKSSDGALSPDWSKAGNASVRLTSDADIVLDNVSVGTDEQGRAKTTQVRVKNLDGSATLALAMLAKEAASTTPGHASFVANVLGGDGGRLADVNAKADFATGGKEGGVRVQSADVRLTGVNVGAADSMLAQGGMLVGAMGDTAEVVLNVSPQGTGPGAMQTITANITAPRLKGANLSFMSDGEKYTLTKPASLEWSPDAAFVSKSLFHSDQPGSSLALTKLAPISVQVQRLVVAASQTGEQGGKPRQGPMKPGVFALEATASIPSMSAAVIKDADRRAPATIAIQGLRAGVRSGQQPGSIDAELDIQSISDGVSASSGKASRVRLSATNLADGDGVVNTKNGVYSLDADMSAFPTPVIDQFARQKGVLTEALGPTIDLKATATNVSLAPAGSGQLTQSGVANIQATSARANAEFVGDLRQGTFVQTGGATARIVEIRPELVQALSGGLPLVQSIEKARSDDPALINAQQLVLPIDGDISKLSGIVTVDPGVARFTTQSVLGEVISLSGLKTTNEVGKKLEPFVVRFDRGVATYDRFKLPIGQFTTETVGRVDLVNRQMDCVVYIPLGLLTDKAIGLFGGGGLGSKIGVLDKLTMMPWSVKGSLDNPNIGPDLGLFAKETAGKLLDDPVKQIGDTIDKTIKDLFKPREKETPPAQQAPSSAPPPSATPAPAPANPAPANPPANDKPKPKKPKKPKDPPKPNP